MNELLAQFDAEFKPGNTCVYTTWWRDVEPVWIPRGDLVGYAMEHPLSPWGKELPEESMATFDPIAYKLRLRALWLAWHGDLDQMFYVGDANEYGPGKFFGLLNDPRFEDDAGGSTLLDPTTFGEQAIKGTIGRALPCKWLTVVNRSRLSYARDKLLFKVCWPVVQEGVAGRPVYVGGIAPLALKE